MNRPRGPFKAHIIWIARDGYTYEQTQDFKTFSGAERFIARALNGCFTARWITNAEGIVYSFYSVNPPTS